MRRLLVAAGLTAAVALAAPAAAAVHLTQVGSFVKPVYVTGPPGDPHRLFVVEKAGRIMEVRDGVTLAAPFLDISSEVVSGSERGLLSMAFAPDYAKSRKLYIDYTAPRPGDPDGSIITIQELRTVAGNPDAIDPASRRTLVTIQHPGEPIHHGGQLQFGQDGMLYASTGDGGLSGQDPSNNAQSLASRLGKLLRIDPATGATAIYPRGFRNPWRFSFDPRTGDLILADVGAGDYEEVDFQRAGYRPGANYGWHCFEGFHRTGNCQVTPTGTTPPVLAKSHSADGFCAIVGGYVVTDPTLSGLAGRYVYGDFCNATIRSAALVAPPARVTDDKPTGLSVSSLTSFGEDSCGRLYAASLAGPVYRFDGDAPSACPEKPYTLPRESAPIYGIPPGPPRLGLRLSAKRRQRVVRQRGVRVVLRCRRACRVTVRARMRIAHRAHPYRLRAVVRRVRAHGRMKAKLRFRGHGRRIARRALHRHRRVTIRVTAIARGAGGIRAQARRTVRAVR